MRLVELWILTVCIAAWLVGCGRVGKRELREQVAAISQTYNSSDIVSELAPVYSELLSLEPTTNGDRFQSIYTNRVPEKIRSLPIFAYVSNYLSFELVGDQKGERMGLLIWHEGGPVHRGIIYCPFDGGESVARSFNGGNVIIVPWTNGIYFYDFCL